MQQKKSYFDLGLFFVTLICILFLEDVDLGITLHAFVFAIVAGVFLDSILKPSMTRTKKALAVLLYYSLLVLQLGILVLGNFSKESRFVAAGLLLITFLVEHLIFRRLGKASVVPFADDFTLSFEDLRHYRSKLNEKAGQLKRVGVALSPSAVKEMVMDLPRHRVTRYINKETLSEEYFQELENSLSDPYVYLVFSDTGSVASNLIGVCHQKLYNHISIAFDQELATLISYNGGEKVSPPGLNAEIIEWFYKKEDASIRVYRLKVTREQKEGMTAKIRQIDREGSAFHLLGFARRKALQPNIMFCSQFVYCLLELVGANYFEKSPVETKPSDLIELDYERKLEFVETIELCDYMAEIQEKETEKAGST